ncbi:MAG: lamin tail domain-containing protein, partial [Balneolaceae bacterium]|nr:lamin tail domain-containing protein [Balneolaceae bacterium]
MIIISAIILPTENEVFAFGVERVFLEMQAENSEQVVINELLYRRRAAGEPEFVEIFNTGTTEVDLGGWKLSDSEKGATIPEGITLYPGAYIVFTDQRSFSDPSASIHYLPSWPGFSNAGDAVVLKNAEGVLADSLYYQLDWGRPKAGVSIERKDPSAISIDSSNWSLSSAPFGSTPNEINTAFRIDRESPQIRFVRLMNDLIHIAFTEFVELTDLAR